jgi:hypothetical protein
MTSQTATAATSPSTAESVKTRKVDCEIHTAESLAELTGLPVFMVRSATPAHAVRIGDDYLVVAEHADRLRAIRTGTSPERVYAREAKIDRDRQAAIDKPINDAIAAADAKCRAEREAEKERNAEFTRKFLAREARKLGANVVDAKGIVRNANGDRVV